MRIYDFEVGNVTDTVSKTLDGSIFETWTEDRSTNESARLVPRLRLLYHTDLTRIGATSVGVPLASGKWIVVGRKSPEFAELHSGGAERALDNPMISRAQFQVRWLEKAQCFEVEPSEGAKRKLGYTEPLGLSVQAGRFGVSRVRAIKTRMRLSPGSCVAIEDRVLIGLELVEKHHRTQDDRLGLVGESQAMWHLRRDILEVSGLPKPALILGRTGAGKELVARAVHDNSPRAKGPFVTVNCAALPENLVESLLFGHKKGAFTGADSTQQGMFRAASGGTLFLDELGEMPIQIQPKLLRTVQDGIVTAVGQHQGIKVDVRLIAATNRDPAVEISAGRLREDLYHRLSGHLIRVPALSQRHFDIPELFTRFLERQRGDYPGLAWLWGGQEKWRRSIPMGFFLDLMHCAWTGNVRELENIVERTVRLNRNVDVFRAPELPQEQSGSIAGAQPVDVVTAAPAAQESDALSSGEHNHDSQKLLEAAQLLELAPKTVAKLLNPSGLEELWKVTQGESQETRTTWLFKAAGDRLLALLRAHDFKQRPVVALLGISPSTLIKLMQHFGLPRPSELSREVIEEALHNAEGDLDVAATLLKVSPQGLKRRLTRLKIKRDTP